MCLIVHKPAGTTFHESWLRDFYKRNDDGYGIMYAEGGKLYVHKSLGNADRFVTAFEQRKEKEMLIHLRMRTHGKVDLDNCHPYEVLKGEQGGPLGAVWMMHNGVLGFGNDANKDLSDTWHYINTFIRPILLHAPLLLLDPAFQKLVQREIGFTNKFTFMTSRGDVVIINKDAGVMWEGTWLSNTYAWSASEAKIPGVSSYQTHHGGGESYDWRNSSTGYRSGQTWRDGAWRWPEGDLRGKEDTDAKKPVEVPPTLAEGAAASTTADTPKPSSDAPIANTSASESAASSEVSAYEDIAKPRWPFAASDHVIKRSNFFELLKDKKLDHAYQMISVVDVEAAFSNDLAGMAEMADVIAKDGFQPGIDDEFIVNWVRNTAHRYVRGVS